jgi:hypothetical protein
MLIMTIDPLPDAFPTHWNRAFTTYWIRGFMAFQLVRRTGIVVLMVPTWPESGFRNEPPGPSP